MKKTARKTALGLILALALALPAGAASREAEVPVEITLNGFDLALGGPVWAGNGVTYVPVEEFFRTLVSHPDRGMTGFYQWGWDGTASYLDLTWGEASCSVIPGQDGALFREGVLCAPLRPLAEALGVDVGWDGAVRLTTPKTRVEVDSLEALFNAVDDNTEIVLAPGRYSFADLDLEEVNNPYVFARNGVDGRDVRDGGVPEAYDLYISAVQDLTITSDGATIATPWAYADVLRFEGCRRLALTGLTAVHDVEPGHCVGDCLELEDCRDVRVTDCTLDGSGAYGLLAGGCKGVQLVDCAIQNCTYAAIDLWGCQDVTVADSVIQNCKECFDLVAANDSADVTLKNCEIKENSADTLAQSVVGSLNFVFWNCTFEDNSFPILNNFGYYDAGEAPSGGAAFVDCTGL